jgi:hypothetical protein
MNYRRKVKELHQRIEDIEDANRKSEVDRIRDAERKRVEMENKAALMIQEFKNALPNNLRIHADELFADGKFQGGDIIDSAMKLNMELTEQLARSRDTVHYLKERLMQTEEQLLKTGRMKKLKNGTTVIINDDSVEDVSLGTDYIAPDGSSDSVPTAENAHSSASDERDKMALEAQTRRINEYLKSVHNLIVLMRKPIIDIAGNGTKMRSKLACCHCKNQMKSSYILWKCGHNFCIYCLKTALMKDDCYCCSACGNKTNIGFTENVVLNVLNPSIVGADLEGRRLTDSFNELARVWNEKMLMVKEAQINLESENTISTITAEDAAEGGNYTSSQSRRNSVAAAKVTTDQYQTPSSPTESSPTVRSFQMESSSQDRESLIARIRAQYE